MVVVALWGEVERTVLVVAGEAAAGTKVAAVAA